jgi:phospholipase/carboxylesterase
LSPRPETVAEGHHAQVGVEPVEALDKALRRRAFALPGVSEQPTVISVPGAAAIWLDEDLDVARPDLVSHGREFAHIHPDGSLHVSLPPARATEASAAGWGEPPPDGHHARHVGRLLVYTPMTESELATVIRLLEESYEWVIGGSVVDDQPS